MLVVVTSIERSCDISNSLVYAEIDVVRVGLSGGEGSWRVRKG